MVDSSSLIGRTISHYRVIEKIGAGGMGEVYRARDEQLDRDVALKVLPAGTLTDESARKQFRKEALALAKLNHPNIETVHEFGTQDGLDFLAMELIAGSSLKEKIREGPLAEAETVRLGMQLAEGLAAAHGQGVVHRDLKPANLMLARDGRLKILDFGLAKLIHHEPATDITRSITMESGTISGTVPYMSPEQLRGLDVDPRADIYAVGAVLYEMATGSRPFSQSQSAELMGAILHQPPAPPSSINPRIALGVENVILKALQKEASQRYQSARELLVALEGISVRSVAMEASAANKIAAATSGMVSDAAVAKASRAPWLLVVAGTVVLAALAAGSYFYFHRAPALTEKDTIVLADFNNTTGDPVFDDTLKQALVVDLAQSPFLNIRSEDAVRRTLKEMTRPPDERLTQDLVREVCQRIGDKAYLAGSITPLGSEFVVGLKAVNCANGDVLALEQMTAEGKEQVLPVLGQAAAKLRNKLGESLSSVQKFDVLEATTNSLEALEAYTLAGKIEDEQGDAQAIPVIKHAIELDPNFALAYADLGNVYSNLNQPALAAEYTRKAFELRDRVSENERLRIAALYYSSTTGELEKANQANELLAQVYPRDGQPLTELGDNYRMLGQYPKAAAFTREALRLDPVNLTAFENLGQIELAMNRFDEAKTATEKAMALKLEGTPLHQNLYGLAFLRGDAAGMKEQADWAVGNPAAQDTILSLESDTEAWFGRLAKARELSRRAVADAAHNDEKETAALWQANAAIREALFGNAELARQYAAAAVALGPGSRDAESQAAFAFALAADAVHAQKLADDLTRRFPVDTIVQSVWLPTIRAQIETVRKNAVRSIDLLESATVYELGQLSSVPNSCLYPLYVRAEAYRSLRDAPAVAGEFQKILGHRGLLWNCSTGALARLGLARAYAMQGDTAKAQAAYQDFLALWKDADPDIPILKEARAEYAKLQ